MSDHKFIVFTIAYHLIVGLVIAICVRRRLKRFNVLTGEPTLSRAWFFGITVAWLPMLFLGAIYEVIKWLENPKL